MCIRTLVSTLLVCSFAFPAATTASQADSAITEPCAPSARAAETPRVELRRGTRPSSPAGNASVRSWDLLSADSVTSRVLPRRGNRITQEVAEAGTAQPGLLAVSSRGEVQAPMSRHARRMASRTLSDPGMAAPGLGCAGLAMTDRQEG
jgi:hypothetical protein